MSLIDILHIFFLRDSTVAIYPAMKNHMYEATIVEYGGFC